MEMLGHPDAGKPRLLMVTHVVPYPPAAGNEIRILKLLQYLHEAGCHVVLVLRMLEDIEVSNESLEGLASVVDEMFVFDNRVSHGLPSATSEDARLIVDAAEDSPRLSEIQDWFAPMGFVAEVGRIAESVKPDIVISQYIFFSRVLLLPDCREALKVIDTHDLFSKKEATAEQYGIDDYALCLSDEEESLLLKRADSVLAIQVEEKNEIAALVPSVDIVHVGVDLPIVEQPAGSQVDGRVLIVASGNEFNVQGVRDFIELSWPMVRETVPSARLHIVGKVCDYVRTKDPSITLLGFVADLEPEFAAARVVVNPCRVGTGLKIKTIEALAHGRAHVAWPSAADGLRHETQPLPLLVAEDVVELSDHIAELLTVDDYRCRMESMAKEFARAHLSPSAVYAELGKMIASLGNPRQI